MKHKVKQSPSRHQKVVQKRANELLDRLMIRFLEKLAHSGDPEGEYMAEVFSNLNRQWINWARKNVKDGNHLFETEAKSALQRIKNYAEAEAENLPRPVPVQDVLADQEGERQGEEAQAADHSL